MASKRFSRLIKILSGAISEVEDDILHFEGRTERFLHFWALTVRQFIRNRCPIRAAALSYSSLLALIPLLAVAISVTSSLLKQEGEEKIYQGIDKFVAALVPPAPPSAQVTRANFPPTSPVVSATNSSPAAGTNQSAALTDTNAPASTNQLAVSLASLASDERVVSAQKTAAKSIHDFVQQTQSGKLGVIGMLLLVFVAIRMLANIEATFNDIWGVTQGRSWVWRIVLYWTTITLGPLAVVGVLGLSGSSHLQTVKDFFQQMPFIGSLLFDILPLVLLWLIFALVYLTVPNTKVKFSAALVGGIVAGSAWHVNNLLGFLFASRLVTNSKIYGPLGLVPVIMVGLYFTWVILLFGAQVAYAFQNRSAYLQNRLADNVNQRGREFVALRLMTSLAQRFQNRLPPATILQLAAELGVPGPLAQSILRTLAYKQLVMEVAGAEAAFAPARPLEAINAYDILLAMRTGTGQELPLNEEPSLAGIYGEFARIEQAERAAASSLSLHALALRQPRRQELAEPAPAAAAKQITDVERIVEPKTIAAELARPKTEPVPVATPQPVRQPTPAPPPQSDEANSATLGENSPARREVVMPAEDREFPL